MDRQKPLGFGLIGAAIVVAAAAIAFSPMVTVVLAVVVMLGAGLVLVR